MLYTVYVVYIENRICIRVEFTRKKCKTAILLYCFHTTGRDVNVFIFQKNDRFVKKKTTKNRKRNDLFQKRSFFLVRFLKMVVFIKFVV